MSTYRTESPSEFHDFGLWAGDDEQTLRTAVSSYVGPAPIKGEER